MGKMTVLTAADGHKLDAYVAEPAGKPRGGIVVIQEIFGVNSHIKAVADGYAADGYLAVAPAMYDRVQKNYDTGYTPEEIQAGLAVMQKLFAPKATQTGRRNAPQGRAKFYAAPGRKPGDIAGRNFERKFSI